MNVQEMSHPTWQRAMWSGKSADISNFNNLGNLFTENVMIQTRNSNSSETFAPNQLVNGLVQVRHVPIIQDKAYY